MKKMYILTVLSLVSILGSAQTRTVQYNYDAAGNRIRQEVPRQQATFTNTPRKQSVAVVEKKARSKEKRKHDHKQITNKHS